LSSHSLFHKLHCRNNMEESIRPPGLKKSTKVDFETVWENISNTNLSRVLSSTCFRYSISGSLKIQAEEQCFVRACHQNTPHQQKPDDINTKTGYSIKTFRNDLTALKLERGGDSYLEILIFMHLFSIFVASAFLVLKLKFYRDYISVIYLKEFIFYT
jgi:hypothetical protein